jgi:hypothetical protein
MFCVGVFYPSPNGYTNGFALSASVNGQESHLLFDPVEKTLQSVRCLNGKWYLVGHASICNPIINASTNAVLADYDFVENVDQLTIPIGFVSCPTKVFFDHRTIDDQKTWRRDAAAGCFSQEYPTDIQGTNAIVDGLSVALSLPNRRALTTSRNSPNAKYVGFSKPGLYQAIVVELVKFNFGNYSCSVTYNTISTVEIVANLYTNAPDGINELAILKDYCHAVGLKVAGNSPIPTLIGLYSDTLESIAKVLLPNWVPGKNTVGKAVFSRVLRDTMGFNNMSTYMGALGYPVY